MMQIDTSAVIGWEDITVVLEFQHRSMAAGARYTTARLVEISPDDSLPSSLGWRQGAKCWKRTVARAYAHCSLVDQYCRETGRRVAIRRLSSVYVGYDVGQLTSCGDPAVFREQEPGAPWLRQFPQILSATTLPAPTRSAESCLR